MTFLPTPKSRASAFFAGGPSGGAALAEKPTRTTRPYPAPKPGTNMAKAAAREMFNNERSAGGIIDPAIRHVLIGHSRYCPTCQKFTRCPMGFGGCPGMISRSGRRPLCHSSEQGQLILLQEIASAQANQEFLR